MIDTISDQGHPVSTQLVYLGDHNVVTIYIAEDKILLKEQITVHNYSLESGKQKRKGKERSLGGRNKTNRGQIKL